MKQMLYWELEKQTLPSSGDRIRFSSVEYMLKQIQSERQARPWPSATGEGWQCLEQPLSSPQEELA